MPRAEANRLNLALWLILTLCVVRLWLMPLPSSFWVDEMGSVFVVHHGAGDPTLSDAPQVADSIYYWLPALAEKVAGLSEISYRFFSVVAMGVALFAIARLAARLIDPAASWFVIFGCLASRNFNYQAADARPYALGTMILSLGLWGLVRWLDEGKWRDVAVFAICAGALWWVHLVFWPFYLIFLAYGGYRLFTSEHRATKSQILVATAVVIAACIPVALRALALLQGASTHVVVEPPELGDLARELKLLMITGACTVAAVLSQWWKWSQGVKRFQQASLVFVLAWWLIDPTVVFAFSRLTGNSLWVPRYMFLALPGVAFAACLLTGMFLPSRLWKPAAIWLGCGVLVFGGHWNRLWPEHQRSDWRAASTQLGKWVAGVNVPVICPSTFVEARPPVWTPQYPLTGFLYSHLAVYPTAGHIYPLPFESSPEATAFARELTRTVLPQAGRFAIYGGDRNVKFWQQWFASQPEFRTWRIEVQGLYGDVALVTFRGP